MGRRKKHVPQQTDGMRSMWEFVFVSQFLRVFQSKFGFVRFTAKDLETSLVEPDNENLFGIFSRLLQELSQRQDIKVTSWQDYMKDELKERESEKNPMRDGRPYSKLSPEDRVLLLKFLIDLIIDNGNKELKDFADGFLDTNSTQVKPIGTDACNNIYWYFEDLRLYRETPGRRGRGSKKGQTRLNWETICVSLEDWDNILRTFKKSSNSNEKKLHQYLKNELYPQVMPLIKENEKEEESESLKSKELPRNQQKELEIAEEESNAVREDEGEEEDKELNQGTMRKVEEVQTGGVDFEQMASEKVTEKEKEKDTEHRKRGRRKEIDKQVPVVYNTNLESHDNQHGQYMELGRKDHPLAMDAGRPVKQRRRYSRLQEQEELEKIRKDRDELEKKVDEEIKKQENLLKEADLDSGLVPRSKRRCVIMREQMNKKKEWWEEENIGSDDEEDEDADSDNSDGPRKRRKAKLSRPVEMPIPPGRQRVYVFSTTLANRAAEAVHQGSYDGIVSFHLAQSATTPFLRLENNTRVGSHDMMEQQKGYISRQTGQNMTRGYGGYPHPDTGVQPGGVGYGNQQWSQFQQQYHKDRQQQSQVMEDIQHLLFGNGNQSQSSGTPSNGLYSRGSGHNHQQSGMGQQMSQFGFSGNHAPSGQQPSSPFMDCRMHDHYRQQMQQQAYQRYSSQQQQQQQQQQTQQNLQQQKQSQQPQQQQFFQRSSMLSSLQSPSPQSPTSVPSPLGNSVRSPPPPYPGNRTTSTDNRNSGTSPAQVPSPRSGGSPQTPQTPLTPHTPRGFQATGLPSPTDVPKQPYSPSNQQSNFSGYSRQSSTHSQGGDSDTSHSQIPGFIELPRVQKSTMQPAAQNSYSIRYGNYDNRSAEETPLGSSLHSPSELSPRAAAPFHGGPPNKSPFPGPANQLQPNQGPYSSTSKSFSVESLTAPTQPSERNSHPVSGSEQSPYSGFYYPNKYPQMYSHTHAQYQYPPAHLQHPGSYYNSQYGSNMYLGRGSLPVHHPTRDSGL